jgi:hypothetical protein
MFYLHSCEAKSLALFSLNSRINGILLFVMGESEENVEKYLNKNAISSEFNEFSVEKFEASSAKNIKLRMIAQLNSPLSLHNNRRLYKKSIKSIFKSIKIEIFCILSSADNHFWHTIRTGKVQLSTAQLH